MYSLSLSLHLLWLIINTHFSKTKKLHRHSSEFIYSPSAALVLSAIINKSIIHTKIHEWTTNKVYVDPICTITNLGVTITNLITRTVFRFLSFFGSVFCLDSSSSSRWSSLCRPTVVDTGNRFPLNQVPNVICCQLLMSQVSYQSLIDKRFVFNLVSTIDW